MASYSSQFKEQAVSRLMPPNSQTVSTVSQDLGVSGATLYAGRSTELSPTTLIICRHLLH